MKAILRFLRHFYQSALRKEKRDWEVIGYCVLVSGLFWFLNAMGKVYHHELKIPVEYRYNQSIYVPVTSMPEYVEVRAEGRGWDLVRAMWARSTSSLLVPVKKPLQTFNLLPAEWQPALREMLPSVRLEAVLTDSIYCRFDPIESREIPLIADLKDFSVKAGYRISGPVKITPSSIRFTGAASMVRNLPPQLPVSISGNNVQESYDQNLSLDFQDEYPQNGLLRYEPDKVNVHFSVRSALEDEMEVQVQLENAASRPGLFLKEDRIRIHYLVAIPDRQKVQPSGFRVTADLGTFNPADSTVELRIRKHPAIVSDAHPTHGKIRVYGH